MKYRHIMLMPFLFVIVGLLSLVHVQRLEAQTDNSLAFNGSIPSGPVYLPLVVNNYSPPPPRTYHAVTPIGEPTDRPAAIHGDLNLALRSYITTTGELELVNINGDTDDDAPQLAEIFAPARLPKFTDVYQVYDWDWSCGNDGCRGQPLAAPTVTLVEMETIFGEPISIPSRNASIESEIYKAMVLYAEATRITIVYTGEDTVAIGYAVHIEDFTVEPGLLALYQQLNNEGRQKLPAIQNGEVIGYASGATIKVAIRDTGQFMDPRSRKDWWKGY